MMCLRSCLQRFFRSSILTTTKITRPTVSLAVLLASLACLAQQAHTGDQIAANKPPSEAPGTVTIPAGTRLALVLNQPIQTRYMRRGDDLYAQVTSPVDSDNEVVIPPGTFIQGTVEKIERNGGRGEIRLQSMSITFADGYVIPIQGPMTLESSDGYAIKDPGGKRMIGVFALPAAGAGIGALIGHSVGKPQANVTSPFPPGCAGPPPFCTTTTTPVFGTQGRDTVIGAGVGGAIGMLASLTLLFGTHHFYLVAGAPVEMTLQQPVTLQQDEVAKAVQQSQQHPVTVQPVAPLPVYYPPPDMPADHGTCYTPGTPGTPPTVIPGVPGADGIPGAPTIIPGTPPTPGTPYPCP